MDRFEGRCQLNWWANSSTAFVAEIAVVIAATAGGWDAEGHLISDDIDEHEGLRFLCDLDPAFTLAFEDGSTIPVTVRSGQEGGRFALTEHPGPEHQSVEQRIDPYSAACPGPGTGPAIVDM
ncbi:hypothetical protein AB0F68_32880 [Micromonospora sp. NPDC023966]|uniref:hypothetical protein n=1 Tax=Micromonospora sp. NPDC023966 TaxID=3154699 RepID=UPI0033C630E2